MSSIASKIFEHIIILRLEQYLWTNDNQFGFKSGHSTDLCIYALSEFIEYFKSRSTSVYVTFFDTSKAFDKISHWTLFQKLIDRKAPIYLVKILCYWHRHQIMSVRGYALYQKDLMLPMLFVMAVFYPLNCSTSTSMGILNNCTTGGFLGKKSINHMLYADDLCIVSLS